MFEDPKVEKGAEGFENVRQEEDPKTREIEIPWPITDLTEVGERRRALLALKLDMLADAVSGLTKVDPKAYLTDLKRINITRDAEVSNINETRLLLKSVTRMNPKYPHGWIAAARLEEVAGKHEVAQQLIRRGCDECPKSEDVLLEACRLASSLDAKAVIARGVKAIPNSVKLWMEAAKLEQDDSKKSRVLRKGLEHIPDSLMLWKAVVDLANEEDAKLWLQEAVKCCPKEPAIWIAAAKLEEANGNTEMVGKVIGRGIRALQREGVEIDREVWMKEAEATERGGAIATCQAVIRKTIKVGVEEEDRKRTWVSDAEECKKRGSIETARAILQEACVIIPNSKEIWLAAFNLEVENNKIEAARIVLAKARERGGTKRLWMKSAMFERVFDKYAEERRLLDEGLKLFPLFFKLWLMLGQLEESLGMFDEAKETYELGLKHCPSCIPLWLSFAHVEEEVNGLSKARAVLTMARKENPQNPNCGLLLYELKLEMVTRKNMIY